MHKLTVTLKQHTPLIHFQHDQHGATLRASEVKPKLDRFIITKLGGGDYEKGLKEAIAKGWIINHGKNDCRALHYKMRIESLFPEPPSDPNACIGVNERNGNPIFKKSPMFFANMGEKSEKKFYVRSEKCKIEITSLNKDLWNEIIKHIATFFYHTNFGTRQTKGYGSFSVVSSNPGVKFYPPKLFFTVSGDEEKLFEEMEWFHKAIRSGINDCFGKKLYLKSLMFAYAKKCGQQWEKKTMKQAYYPAILNDQKSQHPNSDLLTYNNSQFNNNNIYYTYRDCLGLSSIEDWKNPYNKRIEKKSNSVERMKSPILFKPIKTADSAWKIYIIYSENPAAFTDASFGVTSNGVGNLRLNVDKEFSVQKYFDFLFKKDEQNGYQINIKDMFLVKDNKIKMERILAIFNELRINYNK